MNGKLLKYFFHSSAFLTIKQKSLTLNGREMDDEKLAHKASIDM